MEFTQREMEDFHLRERKWICSQVDLREVLKAQGWKEIPDSSQAAASEKSSPTAMKLQLGWEKIAVDRRGEEQIWMWYKYTQKIGGTLYDRINPDISRLPHNEEAVKQDAMIKVLRTKALRSFARQFIPKEKLLAYYADKRGALDQSIVKGEKVLQGEVDSEKKTALVSLLSLAPKYGFKTGELKALRQYFHFENKETKITISVPIQDPYVFIEHGEKKHGGGVKNFKDRYHMLRQIDLELNQPPLAKQVDKFMEPAPVMMAAEKQLEIKPAAKVQVKPMQADLFQDLTTRGVSIG